MIIPRQNRAVWLLVAALFATLLGGVLSGFLAGCVGAPTSSRSAEKSIWVSRYEYKTRADIDEIMRRCAAAGFQNVFFQVRGNGTVMYSSRFEPWSDRYGFRAPSFDPLSYAIQAARSNRLKLHAWINVMPGWGGAAPPRSKRQLFHTRPEWFLRDDRGDLATEGSYSFLNPCLPEVRTYLLSIIMEVATEYPVDGIHLDYIRYPHGVISERSPGDARSRALFERQTRRKWGDRVALRAWKRGAVTELLKQVRQRIDRLQRPRPLPLTVAVNSNMDRIRKDVLQDWPRWARDGLVDAIYPMNYTEREDLFVRRARACIAAAAGTPVVMGIGVYTHQRARQDPRLTVRQMNAALRNGARGVCLFSYGSTFQGGWAPAVQRWNRGK